MMWGTRSGRKHLFGECHVIEWKRDKNYGWTASRFKLRCVAAPPDTLQAPQSVLPGKEGDPGTPADRCRLLCFGRGTLLAYLKADGACACHTPEALPDAPELSVAGGSAGDARTPETCWSVYLVSSSVSKPYPLHLSHTLQLPTNKGYIRPNETVTFALATDTPTKVTFHVNFGDGATVTTSDKVLSHSWMREGSYVVKIRAISRSTTETQLETVKIENVDEGVAPNLVQVQASIGRYPRGVSIDTTAVSLAARVNCVLSLGDGRVEKFDDLTGLLHTETVTHTYRTAGLYDVSMSCTNDYGTTEDVITAVSLIRSMDYETSVFGTDVTVPFHGAETHHALLAVEIDHLGGIAPVLSGTNVLVPGKAFTSSGEHLLRLKSENEVLRQRVVNLQREIQSVAISAGPLQTEKDVQVRLVFKIFGGDHQHVLLEYGDSEVEQLFYPKGSIQGPIMIHRNHSYKALGKYFVKISVANDVSFARSEQVVSIERPISDAKVFVRNVTFLGEAAEFVFEVDSGVMPAMPVNVDLDLGNGETQRGEIGEMRYNDRPAPFFYTYPKYGIYDVLITVSNNLSSLVLRARIQVGENITHVDMSTTSQLVAVEEEFEMVIDCPQGQPILYEVSTGDGTTIKVSVPLDYTSEHDMIADVVRVMPSSAQEAPQTTTPYTYYTTQEMGVMVIGNDTEVKLARNKRDVEPANGIVTTVIIPTENDAFQTMKHFDDANNATEATAAFASSSSLSPAKMANKTTARPGSVSTLTMKATTTVVVQTRESNEKITVKYKFHSPGQHTVKVRVSNSLSSAETWSCPPIRVMPKKNSLQCDGLKVSTSTPTSEEQPLIVHRSEEVRMGVSIDMSCADLNEKARYDYTWASARRTKRGGLRPELAVCHVGSKDPTLVIPANTLWYGSYRLTVTVHLLLDPMTGRVRREAPGDLKVTTAEPDMANKQADALQRIAEEKEKLTQTLRQQMEAFVSEVPVPEDFEELDLAGKELTLLSATADMFLEIQKTPLVAEFKGEPKLDIPKFEIINLNAEPSHDPDVAVRLNKTGMTAHIFCYPTRLKEEWKKRSFDDKVLDSKKIATNTMETCTIYNHDCFLDYDRVWVLGWEVVFLADLLMKNDTMNFELVVTKDDRTATTEKVVRVLFSDATGVDMLNNIDALLASGDTNAALMVIDLVSGMLDSPSAGASESGTDAKKAKSAVRGKLIGALSKCSGKLGNFDQVGTIVGVMGKVTAVKDEVSTDSKVIAAGALGNSGSACKETAGEIPVNKVTGMAAGLVGCVGNVLPFPEPDPETKAETTSEPQIVVTTTSATHVEGEGRVVRTVRLVTTPTSRTVTTSGPDGESVTTTPVPPTFTPSTTPAVLGNLTVSVPGVGEVTLSEDGWTTTAPLPATTTPTTTTTTAPTTTTTTTTEPTTTTPFHPTTPRVTTTASGGGEMPGFMSTLPPGQEAEPTEEPVIPCCTRTPEAGLCEWVEPACDFLAEDDRKSSVWSDNTCDKVHPDDLEVFVVRFRMFKAMQKRIMFSKRKSTTTNALKAIDSVGNVLLDKSGDDTNISISTPNMKVELGKLEGSANASSGGNSFMGSALNGTTGSIGSMSTKSPNPFTYSDTASDIKSDVKSLSFTDENGTAIVVEDSAEPIDIWIEGSPDKVPAAKLSLISSTKTSSKMNFHNIGVTSNDSSIHVIIRPANPDDEFEVYIKYTDFPNETYYDDKGFIPNRDMESWPIEDADDADDLRHTFFPNTDMTALNGSYKIGVKLIKSVISYKAKPGAKRNSTYTFRVFLSGCRFWDKENDTWSSGGCWVGNLTTIRMTQCQCNHLTSFGGDFVVPPNTIDFSTVFSLANFLEAIPVFVTVGLVLLLYVAMLIWARRQDKKDLIKWGAGPLEDNLPSDTYHYQITVNTGVKKTAGTTSRVSFILSGDTSDTGVRRMSDGKRKGFPSGSIYNFVLSTEQCLGPLTFLRIWHDNTGKGKNRSWMLGQIQINDLQTGEKFFFLCNRWLAVEEDDGMVERILPVAGLGDLTAFKHLFNTSVRKKLTNDHMWVSIMSRPTRSTFTRVQRLSCCVSLLFLTMITNCMFFKSDEKVENPSVLKIGPLTFTLQQVFISIVTTLIVFPPSMVIVIIFRKTRGKKNTVQQVNQVMSKKTQKFKWRTFNPGSSYWTVERTRSQKCKDSLKNFFSCSNNKSKYEEDIEEEKPLNKKKKKNMTLPHWCIYIAWFLVLGSILGSGFFTVLYSMEWGREKSLEWLSTFLLSFFQSVVVVQPFKVLLLAAFISCILRKPDLDDEEGDFDQMNGPSSDNSALMNKSQKDLQALMLQRKMANDALKPPDTEALEAARTLRLQELQMEAVLKECIIYLFFLMVLFFLSYQARDADSFLYSENIKNTFVRNSPALDSTYSVQTWWKFINRAIIPNLYSGNWYNGKELDWRERLQMDDRNTMRVGVGRIRQHRIKDDTCVIRKEFQTIIHHCRDAYGWTEDDTKDYLTAWEVPSSDTIRRQGMEACYMDDLNDSNETSLHDEESPWVYRSSFELKNAPYQGTLAIYKGGGYTFTFKRTMDHTIRLLQELERYEWVDVHTRSLFIEFTLYNANANLFGSAILLIEFMPTGSAITSCEVKVFRLSSYIGGFGVVVIIFEVLFLGFVIFFFVNTCKMIRKERMKFFGEFWNLLEFSMLVMSIISIVMYAMKKVFGNAAMALLQESESAEYVNFVTISIWDELFGFILATVVFCATIKFIKMLKFNRRMGMLGSTIKLATKDLKNFSVVFFIFFFAFCMMGYVLFGRLSPTYGSFTGAVQSLFRFTLGDFDFEEMRAISPFLGPLFFFMFVCVIFIGMMSMFLTIIYDSFATVKADTENQSNDYEIVEFMMKRFKGVFGWS